MLSYLFLPVLLSGVVGLQTGNSTASAYTEELRELEVAVGLLSNQTFNLPTEDDGVMKPGNMTSSLHKDESSKLEEELELDSTDALNETTEDDGVVGSQTGNSAASAYKEELRKLEVAVGLLSNQTFNLPTEDDGVMKPGNMTSSLHKDESSKLEKELELDSTDALNVTTEDDESFQDQEHFHSPANCDEETLVYLSYSVCGTEFYKVMMEISAEHWCDLGHTIRPYNDMTRCMELLTGMVHCYYPNPSVQEFFLHIHSLYFHNCSDEGPLLADAPHGVVVVLTLIPVSLIPVLVFLVVWKSKVRD